MDDQRHRDRAEAYRDSRGPKTSRFAVASLVLGLVALLVPRAGLAAITCGVVALATIWASKGRRKGKGLAIAGLVMGVVLPVVHIVFMAGVVLPRLARALDEARSIRCQTNLKLLESAIHAYARDYDNWTPTVHPRARELANAAGAPAGCVLAFRDADGSWKATGLGLLYSDRSVLPPAGSIFYCPALSGSDASWVTAFSYDEDEVLWERRKPGPADADGVGELPGNPDVMVCSYVLRCNPQYEHGAWRLPELEGKGVVSDLLLFASPGAVQSHGGRYNILFLSGGWERSGVRQFDDKSAVIDSATTGVAPADIEATVNDIFAEYFDPLH